MANTKHQDDAPVLPPLEQLRLHTYEQVRPGRAEGDSALCDARGTLRRIDGTVIDTLKARKLITPREWVAGDRLRTDFFMAGLEPRITATYEVVVPGGGDDVAAWRVDADRRWRAAIKGVGKTVSSVLVALIVEDVGPSDLAARQWGYASRSAQSAGIAAVRIALGALADFYQLP